MKTSCSLPLLRTAIRHLSHPGRRAQSAGLTPAIILPGQHYNPAALRGHTPVLTAGWRRRFRRRPKRSPDGSEAGPRAEPHGGAAETDGEAARAPQPGGAARLPPARHGCRARRGAPPERATPGSSRRKARPPRPLPARLAASRARPEPRRGPATSDSLRPTFPVRRSARPRSPAAHGTGPPTPTGETVTRGYGREPAPAACAIQTAPRCMLGRAPPRSASARAVPEQSALWRPRRSRPPARAALCGGARPQGSGGAVVARGGRPPAPRTRGSARPALPAVFCSRASWKEAGAKAGSAGVVWSSQRRHCIPVLLTIGKAFWCVMFLEYFYWIGNFATFDLYCIRRQLMTQHGYELQMLKLAEKSTLTAVYSWVQTAFCPWGLGVVSALCSIGYGISGRTWERKLVGKMDCFGNKQRRRWDLSYNSSYFIPFHHKFCSEVWYFVTQMHNIPAQLGPHLYLTQRHFELAKMFVPSVPYWQFWGKKRWAMINFS